MSVCGLLVFCSAVNRKFPTHTHSNKLIRLMPISVVIVVAVAVEALVVALTIADVLFNVIFLITCPATQKVTHNLCCLFLGST